MKTKRRWLAAMVKQARQSDLPMPWQRGRRGAVRKRLEQSTTTRRAVNS